MAQLSETQIDQVLQMQTIGHLGVLRSKAPHVVPIAYVFDGKNIYARSKEGEKIKLMRKNPQVCLQVDAIDNIDKWRSVIIHGRYQELTDEKDLIYASNLIADRFDPILSNDVTRHRPGQIDAPGAVEKARRAVYFMIVPKEKSGRFEKPTTQSHF